MIMAGRALLHSFLWSSYIHFADAGIDINAERQDLGPLQCVVSESREVIDM